MTQQVNLYAPAVQEKAGPLWTALAIAAVTTALLLAFHQWIRDENDKLQVRVKQSAAQLATEKNAVKSMKDALATRTDPARLAAELAALKTRATEAQEIMSQLQSGKLGTLDGYGGYMLTLARVGEPGVWLTSLKISDAGKSLEVEGRSLQADGVLRYAGELNRQVAPFGATLTSVEMTPGVSAADRAVTAVSFKLN
jgi:hypothetical protein